MGKTNDYVTSYDKHSAASGGLVARNIIGRRNDFTEQRVEPFRSYPYTGGRALGDISPPHTYAQDVVHCKCLSVSGFPKYNRSVP